jgi:2-hydroxychromene-2-carboxylate isomerase
VKRPRVYFSFRSPFSWMAMECVRRRAPELLDTAELFPYWDPDAATGAALAERGAEFHYTQMSRAKHLYVLADTKRQARRLGLQMSWPVDVDPHWEVPHLAWLAARRRGEHDLCYSALVTARWSRGEDICDRAVLRRVAEGAGLDGAALADAADDPDLRAEGVGCLAAAYEDDVFGVPYFKVGWQRFWGLDRVGQFLDAVPGVPAAATGPGAAEAAPAEDPLAGVPELVRANVGAYDTDTAGGCG